MRFEKIGCYPAEMAPLPDEVIPPDLGMVLRDKTVEKLCEASYDPKLGARPARTVVQEYVDDMAVSCMSSIVKIRAV